MSEFQVEVVTVGEVTKHPNADSLFVTVVKNGYPVIIRSGEFVEGDKAVYLPVDSLVPVADSRFSFLANKDKLRERERIKAKRLRGIFSMGLLVKADPAWDVGRNVQTELNVTKYEPPEPLVMGGENEKDPGFLPVYTDIEGLRKYSRLLADGEEVVLTEKIHGCVTHDTQISLADGSRKPISQVEVGDEVLGVDAGGKIIATKVVRRYDNGVAERWLKVTGTRSGAGRGGSFFRVNCTPEHKFWSKSGYVLAADLVPGMAVSLLRSELGLTPLQEQVLLGKMLEYKPLLVEQRILAVETAKGVISSRYDLETATHNYFANGVLVHNSNGRWLWRDDRLWAGSHTTIKKENVVNMWWRVALQYGLKEKLGQAPNVAFYGEVFGPVQDLKYGTAKNELRVAFFDAMDTVSRAYLDYDEFAVLLQRLGLPQVPVLYRGPWSKELWKYAEGNSVLAAHVREGFVVRPVKERFHQELGGRVILKLHGEGYLLR